MDKQRIKKVSLLIPILFLSEQQEEENWRELTWKMAVNTNLFSSATTCLSTQHCPHHLLNAVAPLLLSTGTCYWSISGCSTANPPHVTLNRWDKQMDARTFYRPYSNLIWSLAVFDPMVGHSMDVLSPFISVFCHSDYERKVVQQLCEKQHVAWKWDLACKERKCGGTSASRDENGQVDVWR